MRLLRASAVLASLARIASALSVPQSGEPMPGSSPALAGAPPPDGAGVPAAPARPLRRSLRAAVAEVTISGMPFIAKPFTPDALVERVRMILDAPSPFARPAPPTPPDPAPGA